MEKAKQRTYQGEKREVRIEIAAEIGCYKQ